MKVNWIKDADAALAEAKTSKKPLLLISAPRLPEALVLGWKPSPTAMIKSLHSSTRTSSHSRPTSKNIPPTSIVSMRCGHPLC